MKMFIRSYACGSMKKVMSLVEEFEEIALEDKAFDKQAPGWGQRENSQQVESTGQNRAIWEILTDILS